MSQNPQPFQPSRPGQPARQAIGWVTPPSKVVILRIAFSGQHPTAVDAVGQRLSGLLHSAGITACVSAQLVMLVSQRPITPARWSRIVGWLLVQPEVVLVARLSPATRRTHGQA